MLNLRTEVYILISGMQRLRLEVVDLSRKMGIYKKGRNNFILVHAKLEFRRLKFNINFHILTPRVGDLSC